MAHPRLVTAFLVLLLLSPGSLAARAAAAPPQPAASVLARTGDPAPGTALVRGPFGGRIALTPSGGRLFPDILGSALHLVEGGETRVLLHVGDPMPGGGVVGRVGTVAAGGGLIAALVGNSQGSTSDALIGVAPGGGVASVELARGQSLALRGGAVTIGLLIGLTIDGSGRMVTAVLSAEGPAAIVRRPPGGPNEILMQTGDPLGASTFLEPLMSPTANAAGAVVFDAATTAGSHVLALRAADGAVTTLFEAPATPCCPYAPLHVAPAAINEAGEVAFLWSSGGEIRVQRVAGGSSQTVASPGSPAPGGGTFTEISLMAPAIDALGGVVFGARRSNGLKGIYRHRSQAEVVAEEGGDAGGGLEFTNFYMTTNHASPAVTPEGAILFAAVDANGDAIFARDGPALATEIRAGDPITGVARFISFFESSFPYLGAGPFMAPGGDVIFDGRTTGARRGLYARRMNSQVRPVALDGDPAPGGGHFDGEYLSFHSINDDGIVAFLGATPDAGSGSSLSLFHGPAGGPLTRILGVGDSVPGSTALLSGFLPPSRVNAIGAIALPVALSDGSVVLLGWDGAALRRVAGPGDVVPGEGEILLIRTGVPRGLLPPLLDDAGNVLFGATTVTGGTALYEAPLVENGSGSARRVLGAGDLVEGGVLAAFTPRMVARDGAGRLAFQAVPDPPPAPFAPPVYATYHDAGGGPFRVVAPGDVIPAAGTVTDVRPHLAAAGDEGVVHEVQTTPHGYWLMLAVPRTPPEPGTAFDQVILVGPGRPSPDGGSYLHWASASPPSGGAPPVTDRLASDGGRLAAMLTRTTAGPETLVLFDLRPNLAPAGDAGPDQTIECAGPEGALVALDGTASSDPETGPLDYEWSGPFGVASGAQPVVTIPLGTWTVTLTVRDAEEAVAVDTVTITVRDTVAPTLSVRAAPATLWPPDGRMRVIFYLITVVDVCDPDPDVALVDIAIVDPKGADPATEIAGASYGTDDRIVQLRARRSGGEGGRTYTATYRATDGSGNPTTAPASVLVPQNLGR